MKAKPFFDPKKGAQKQSTGVLGSLFMIGMIYLYSLYRINVLPGGGPDIPNVLTWLPKYFQFQNVTRDYFDVMGIGILGFLFMAAWELASTRFFKTILFFLLGVGFYGLARISQGNLFPTLYYLSSSAWTGFEIYGLILLFGILFVLIGSIPAHSRKAVPWILALKMAVSRWLAGLTVFTGLLILVYSLPFFEAGFYLQWRLTCGFLYSFYLFLGLPYGFLTHLLRPRFIEDRKDPCFVLLLIFKNFGVLLKGKTTPLLRAWRNRSIRIALRDLAVKLIFIPLLISVILFQARKVFTIFPGFLEALQTDISPTLLFDWFYVLALHSILVVDVYLAFIGYICSLRWLDNHSKSVDGTYSGWFVCLLSYPPLNILTYTIFPYNEMLTQTPWISSVGVLMVIKGLTILLYGMYVWSTMCFGLRFSNLTNRGIITTGPYRLMRHPMYVLKNSAWWLEYAIYFPGPMHVLYLLGWNAIYVFRAITEERHLKQDPDYQAYCETVRYKLIPGVW